MQCMHLLLYKRIRYHWMRFRRANLPCHIYCVTHHDRTILLVYLGMGQLRCCTTVVVLKTIKKPQQDWAAATIYGCVYLSINPQMIVHSTPFSNLILVKSSIFSQSQADEAMGATCSHGGWWMVILRFGRCCVPLHLRWLPNDQAQESDQPETFQPPMMLQLQIFMTCLLACNATTIP